MGSLRLEKGYRDFGHDMDNTDTLLNCGLGFTCNFDHEFIGKGAVVQEKARNKDRGGMNKRLLQILLVGDDGEEKLPLLHHGEIVMRDGVAMGEVRVGSYGHTLGGPTGLVMCEAPDGAVINKKYLDSGDWTVQIANEIVNCKISIGPMYDPKNVKIKA